MPSQDDLSGRWVMWKETHAWWRLPDAGGSFAFKGRLRTVESPEAIPDRRRRLISTEDAGRRDMIPMGQVLMRFPGDIVAVTQDVFSREMELIWWDL